MDNGKLKNMVKKYLVSSLAIAAVLLAVVMCIVCAIWGVYIIVNAIFFGGGLLGLLMLIPCIVLLSLAGTALFVASETDYLDFLTGYLDL